MRQRSKSRIYERTLPQRKHRRTTRDLYFGFFFARAITDFFAIINKVLYINKLNSTTIQALAGLAHYPNKIGYVLSIKLLADKRLKNVYS